MYVSISRDLKNDVETNISTMARRELATLTAPPQFVGNEPFITDIVWGQHIALLSLMPKEWIGKASSFRIEFSKEQTGLDNTIVLGFGTHTEFQVPPQYNSYHNKPVLGVTPELQAHIDHLKAVKEIEARWKAVRLNVTKFLDNCKSLNEGLKLWPDLSMYIPKQYIDKVNKKTERSQASDSTAAAFLKEIDTDALTAAVVIARMSQPA